MLKKFYDWYVAKFKKHPFASIVGGIVTLFVTLGGMYGGFQAVDKLVSFLEVKFFEDRALHRNLEKINTGLTVDYVNSIIGKPVITKRLPDELAEDRKNENGEWTTNYYDSGLQDYKERIYVHKKYFLQIIANKDDSVVAYAITIRDPSFNPKIPLDIYQAGKNGKDLPYISGLKLGKMKLSALKTYLPVRIRIWNTSKFVFYYEENYFGFPGFYKSYLFAWSPAGCLLGNDEYRLYKLSDETSQSIQNKKILSFRSQLA